jgi:hypothetical protein
MMAPNGANGMGARSNAARAFSSAGTSPVLPGAARLGDVNVEW